MIVGIIQARNGSTRLPFKSIAPLAGKPLLYRFIERVKRAELLDKVVLATTTKDEDLSLVEIAKDLGVETFRGSENDLVDRIYRCALLHGADTIVRLCADNPLIEGTEIDRIITHYLVSSQGGFLYSNTHNIQDNGYPDGLGAEVYDLKTFEWLWNNVNEPEMREHPHLYFYDNNLVRTIKCPRTFSYPDVKLDVNTMEEYLYIKKIYEVYGDDRFYVTDYIGGLNGRLGNSKN